VKASKEITDHSERPPHRSLSLPLPVNQMASPDTEWRAPSECTRSVPQLAAIRQRVRTGMFARMKWHRGGGLGRLGIDTGVDHKKTPLWWGGSATTSSRWKQETRKHKRSDGHSQETLEIGAQEKGISGGATRIRLMNRPDPVVNGIERSI